VKSALLAFAALVSPDTPTPARLPPVEQCYADPSFTEFRARLRSAVSRQDRAALMEMVADDVLVDFGGGTGKAAFVQTWGLERPDRSTVWAELASVLGLGCAPSGEALVSPSLVAQFPEQLDAFDTLIARPGARLREKPDDLAPVLATLDWHVLAVTESVDVAPWSGVTLVDGRKGYVRGDQMLSPIGYRAVFEKRGGRWVITAFVAGD
jgi:hypothetical protein